MKKGFVILLALFSVALVSACQGGQTFHKTDLPDPAAFDAEFSELDGNGNKEVNWSEFKQRFPEASPEVFMALDLNEDAAVDSDEWNKFKAAHDM